MWNTCIYCTSNKTTVILSNVIGCCDDADEVYIYVIAVFVIVVHCKQKLHYILYTHDIHFILFYNLQ